MGPAHAQSRRNGPARACSAMARGHLLPRRDAQDRTPGMRHRVGNDPASPDPHTQTHETDAAPGVPKGSPVPTAATSVTRATPSPGHEPLHTVPFAGT